MAEQDDTERVYITRDTRGETVGGLPRPPRVHVTGPHFDTPLETGIYSSTEDKAEATVFERSVAERLLALGKWQTHTPHIEEIER